MLLIRSLGFFSPLLCLWSSLLKVRAALAIGIVGPIKCGAFQDFLHRSSLERAADGFIGHGLGYAGESDVGLLLVVPVLLEMIKRWQTSIV